MTKPAPKRRKMIAPRIKQDLIAKAGGKCANPGCTAQRLEIHHIRHWAVFQAHDAEHMIAVCPTCHDACHHGMLKISDDDLYRWKGMTRPAARLDGQLFVEQAENLRLLTGSVSFATAHPAMTVFRTPNGNSLGFTVLDGDLLQVDARVVDLTGVEQLRVVRNVVRVQPDARVTFEIRPGRARITAAADSNFVPAWMLQQVRLRARDFAADGAIVVMELEVVAPGLVRATGLWPGENEGIFIDAGSLSFCRPGYGEPYSFVGEGVESCIVWRGPMSDPVFQFFQGTEGSPAGAPIGLPFHSNRP